MAVMKKPIIVVLGGVFAASAFAKPALCPPKAVYAVPGIECNVYYHTVTDAVRPQNFAFDARCSVGKSFGERWAWTPTAADAGRSEPLVIRMWDDDVGMFACATTTVRVATAGDTNRTVTVALLGDSIGNNGYQDRVMAHMYEAGFANYRPVGSRAGSSAAMPGEFPKGKAPHDCYGGYGFEQFLTSYKLSVDELDNTQAEAEREQLKSLGVVIPPGQEWRKALLKSPLLQLKKGKVVFDVQAWFDRINGGEAPDIIQISTGSGGMCWADPLPGGVEKALAERIIPPAKRLVAALRAAAPNALIVLEKQPTGCEDTHGFGTSYGCAVAAFAFRRNMQALYRALDRMVEESGDKRLVTIAPYVNVDPIAGYPHANVPCNASTKETQYRCVNAIHENGSGGIQYGDAVYAALRNLMEEFLDSGR